MKKLAQKLRKRTAAPESERITNETVSEHRKRILASGRKFKYPLQYSRHKLVINTIIISILAVVLVVVFGWWQLYPQQNTSAFAYRVVSVLPLPVAEVDGERVRYSDYLLHYRSSEHYLQEEEQAILSGEDGERQRSYIKQRSMRNVIADAYAMKLARANGITVTDQEVTDAIKQQIEARDITERTYYATIQNYFNWNKTEHGRVMYMQLLRQKVAYDIDGEARATAEQVRELVAPLKPSSSWGAVIKKNQSSLPGATHGVSGMVPKSNRDGGLAEAAAKLKQGETSQIIMSSTDEGYYYSVIRLINSSETHVSYEFVTIPLTKFQTQLDALYDDGKVNVFINVSPRDEGGSE